VSTRQTNWVQGAKNFLCAKPADTNYLLQTSEGAQQELAAQIDDLLNTLSNKFSGVSSEIFAKSKSRPNNPSHPLYAFYTRKNTKKN
jgi:hypothetical protein